MKSRHKLQIILLIMGVTYFYSYIQRNKFADLYNDTVSENILDELPDFEVNDVFSDEVYFGKDFLQKKQAQAVIVHFWGTWCGPCEAEFPELIDLTKKLKDKNVIFLLIAVNDEIGKVKKYLERYPDLQAHIVNTIDVKGGAMEKFGTFKVPETFIFDKNGKVFKKFVGPQGWRNNYYYQLLTTLLENQLSS